MKAKALGVARALRLQGKNDIADEIEQNINTMLAQGRNIVDQSAPVSALSGRQKDTAKKYGLD